MKPLEGDLNIPPGTKVEITLTSKDGKVFKLVNFSAPIDSHLIYCIVMMNDQELKKIADSYVNVLSVLQGKDVQDSA